MIDFKNSGNRVSDLEINYVEKRLTIKLPNSYREFLMHQNGGTPTRNYMDLRSFDVDELNTNLFVRIDR